MNIMFCIERMNQNDSDAYTRNRIRKYIIPALKQESPSVYQHSRLISEQLSEDEKYFLILVDSLMCTSHSKEGRV